MACIKHTRVIQHNFKLAANVCILSENMGCLLFMGKIWKMFVPSVYVSHDGNIFSNSADRDDNDNFTWLLFM